MTDDRDRSKSRASEMRGKRVSRTALGHDNESIDQLRREFQAAIHDLRDDVSSHPNDRSENR